MLFRYASQAIKVLQHNKSSSSSSSCVSQEIKILCFKLDQNELEELRLGWGETQFRCTRKEVQALCTSICENTSLRKVAIGWRLDKTDLNCSFLPAIARLPNLQILELSVHAALDESIMKIICQNPSLQELVIQGARLRRKVGIYTPHTYLMEDCTSPPVLVWP